MNALRIRAIGAVALVFAIVTCFPKDDPTGVSGASDIEAPNADWAYPDERRAVELAGVIPGLAGFYHDTLGNVIVALTDVSAPPAKTRLLRSKFAPELLRGRVKHPNADIIVRGATYTFVQLRAWRKRLMNGAILERPGVVWLDLDEVGNRLVVGLDDGGDPMAIRAVAQSMGVPAEVVDVEVSGRYVPNTTLVDEFRPIQGGIRIQRVSGTSRVSCTLGFTALWNDQHVFLTAGHCSPNLMSADNVAQYQPTAPLSHTDSTTMTPLGREISRYSQGCGNNLCANSDAAIYNILPDTVPPIPPQIWLLGRVARPDFGCAPGPCNPVSLNVSTFTPYWTIASTRQSFVVNDLVSKVGSATGWSQGWVQRTCVNVSPTQGVTYFCQMFANYGADDGDSGSPIILDIQGGSDSSVTLGGIHSGRAGNNRVFSPWSGIVQDYGTLVVVPPASPPVPSVPPDSEPSYLYDDSLIVRTSPRLSAPFVRNVVVVLFVEGTPQSERQAAIDQIAGEVVGGSLLPDGDGFYLVRIADDGTENPLFAAISLLESRPSVEIATPELLIPDPLNYRRPNDGPGWNRANWAVSPDSAFGSNWAPEAVAAPLAWGCFVGDATTIIATVDHGVSDQVNDLQPNLQFTYRANLFPNEDHATAVASVFAARGNNGSTQVGITGMMWQANLRLYEAARVHSNGTPILDQFGRPVFTDRGTAVIVAAAAASGARVINVSMGYRWGGAVPGSAADTTTIRRVVRPMASVIRRMRGATRPLIVFSGGNDALDAFWNGYPILADTFPDRVLAVAASALGNTLWASSDTGHLVALAAPGENVTVLNHLGATVAATGTSFATPHVSGAAGLLFAFRPSLTAAQVRGLLVNGAIAGGRQAGGIPLLNAYQSLKLAAQATGAPLCGNRVWVADNEVVSERDTTSHSTEELVALGERGSLVNVRHDGRRIEVFAQSGNRAFARNPLGQWVETQDTATTPYGGTYLSLLQLSHDLDSAVGITPRSGDGFVDLDVKIRDFAANTNATVYTIHVPLPYSGSYVCLTGGSPCGSVLTSHTMADWRFAYSPQGDRVFVSVTTIFSEMTGASGFAPCPWEQPGAEDPSTCQSVFFHTATQGTQVHSISLPSGAHAVLWTIPQQVYWLAGSEDGASVAGAEGVMSQDYVIEPLPGPYPPTGFRINAQAQVVSGCAIVYRNAVSPGTVRHSIGTADACLGQQGQGTIAPAPPAVGLPLR